MYEAFYGLSEKPFSTLPDPDFIYWGRAHKMAFAMLEYGILNHAGFTVVTGDIGCGKTTLICHLLNHLEENVTVGLVSNTRCAAGDLLRWVMMSLGQPYEQGSVVALHQEFQDFLIGEYASSRRTLLIVDEAQNLGMGTLEELRMLSNINFGKDQLLQIVLVGQPQLKELLQRPELVQFAQRISSDFHLQPLAPREVGRYIAHRLQLAGSTRRLFSPSAAAMIAEASQGVPRSINILCDTALVYGFSSGARAISVRIVKDVIEDKRRYGLFPPSGHDDTSPANVIAHPAPARYGAAREPGSVGIAPDDDGHDRERQNLHIQQK